MLIQTKFNIGDRVKMEGRKAFTVDQIRATTLQSGRLMLIEYRSASGRCWNAEKYLQHEPYKTRKGRQTRNDSAAEPYTPPQEER